MTNRKEIQKKKFDETLRSTVYGKVPPQARELEESILGAIMLESRGYDVASRILNADCFYVEAHEFIFEAIISLKNKNYPVDVLTVVEELKYLEKLELVGGAHYVAKLTNNVVSSANIEAHCFIVLQKHLQRELIKLSSMVISDAYEDSSDVFETMDFIRGKLDVISFQIQNLSVEDVDSIANDCIADQDKFSSVENMNLTGFTKWDELNGSMLNKLYFVAGMTSMGKTAFAIQLIKNCSEKEYIGVVNLEMEGVEMANRFITNDQKINNDELKKPMTKRENWVNSLYYKGLDNWRNLKLCISNDKGLYVEQILSKIKYWKEKYGITKCVIDYLQVIGHPTERIKYMDARERVKWDLDRLEKGAAEIGLPLIIFSQLNRDTFKNTNKEPEINNLAEAAYIERAAYQIAFIHRPEQYGITELDGEDTKGLAFLLVKKHRGGRLDRIKLRYEGMYSKFSDWDGDMFVPVPNFDAPTKGDFDEGFNQDEVF